MTTLTDDIVVVAQRIQATIQANATALGLTDVWYGDQEIVPRTPCVAVEPAPLTRKLDGAFLRTLNNFTIYLIVYVSELQSDSSIRLKTDQVATAVATVLHQDTTLAGLVLNGFVSKIEPGYAQRGGTLYRASRLTWTAMNKTALTSP